ncbi:dihydroxyacetone kinase subunit DhaK [Kushneria marisflavi]|uniref:Glycerol kinase n=1 Tax=Kushneria marisflavi TaxID=157779 RepID=A0A240UR52_9GAMM|nr:dihydroxyacetone kinase subunit DhaK [Kushneria marisflavi]ART63971.1 glycerol kinase [Kushneria marisflavi]RKD85694.1 homodimeric dihydroxyacetone kinase [Kushneria marisflavi]
MHHFYNSPEHLVSELLEGLAMSASVTLSDHGDARIVMRADWHPDRDGRQQVALISGGGSGHEPAHAGFVGQGMLTAAVAGDVFASPGVEAILAGIRACCGAAGCLLIIKNYTGDRLNFGLAAERAREEGYRVETVIVADDMALPETPQPRGLAGTLLVHKMAGYCASRGDDLETVHQAARNMAERVRSMGMALSSATLPGQESSSRRTPELGLGIHNEPGVRQVNPDSADDAVTQVLEALGRPDDGPWVALLNNLGSCAPQEMQVLKRACLDQLGRANVALLLGPAPLMTSLGMHGFSITLAPADETTLEAMNAPVQAPAWPTPQKVHDIETFSPRFSQQPPAGQGRHDETRGQLIARLATTLKESEKALDELDARVGDGDAGATFASGAKAVLKALDEGRLSTGEDARLASELGHLLATAMGGSSGVLLSILMTSAARQLEKNGDWPEALQAGIERMQHYGGARKGDRTMLDALIPAVEALTDGHSTEAAAQAARSGADDTGRMRKAGAGRSSLVPEQALDGVVDPGAEAVARLFETLAGRDTRA